MIYLLRHCDKTREAAEAPLSAKGFQQAEALTPVLAKLGIQRILSSPFARAQQSAAPFAKHAGLEVKTDSALAEWRLSGALRPDWQALLRHGLANQDSAAEGGERANEVWARAEHLLAPPSPTLLVTHGGWLTIVLGRFGRTTSLESLLAITSPDLFSISAEGWQNHEL